VADVKEALAALAEQLEIHKRHLQTLHNDSKGFQTRIEQSRALMQRGEHQLKEIRSAVRHLTKKRNDIQSELAEIKETGIIDTTPLEVEEVKCCDVYEVMLIYV
jgi:chromosome segregation ATPase